MKIKKILTVLLAAVTCLSAIPYAGQTVLASDGGLVSDKTEITASQDVYLQAGRDADKQPSSYSNYNAEALRVKNSNNLNTQEYTRKVLLTFELGDNVSDANHAELALRLSNAASANNPGPDFSYFNVYETESWDDSDITWNSSPARDEDSLIRVTGADIEENIVHIDVSSIVENAVQAGKTSISFEFSIDTQVQDNLIDFASTRNTSGYLKPMLAVWTNQLESVEEITVQTRPGEAPELPSAVTVSLIDGTTKEMEVEWEEADPSSYAGIGEFTVSGVLKEEPSITVTAVVTVMLDPDYEGQTYYLDASGGDDDNDGLSPETAWKSLDKVNNKVFLPGDTLLLKAGEIWNGQLRPQGNGAEGRPITIGKYGDASRRPVINGNGEGREGEVYRGAVQLLNQEYWVITSLEVTNSKAGETPVNAPADCARMGILIYNCDQENVKHGFVVRDCYVHDVVSTSAVNTNINYKMASAIIAYGQYTDIYGRQLVAPTEVTASFEDVLFENNIVSNVSREGIRTLVGGTWGNFRKNMKNVVIRNNYIEEVFGDGIVLSNVAEGGVVERNVVKNPCNSNADGAYYAGAWAHWSDNAVFQYNEVYGAMYGSGDGEAFDADNACDGTIFQYNYSHDNNGGACLFMGGAAPNNGQHNTIFRYNVSANDGWKNQEILNDHTNDADDDGVPQVYNNTFYINGDVSTYLYSGQSGGRAMYVNFQNNIVLSESTGTLGFARYVPTAAGSVVKNNIFWPESAGASNGLSKETLLENGNIFADPMLKNPEETVSHDDDGRTAADADEILADPLSVLRSRVSVFTPQEGSPAIGAGTVIEGCTLTEDMMGSPLADTPTIGAIEYVDPVPLKEAIAHAEEVIASGDYLEDENMAAYKEALEDAKAALDNGMGYDQAVEDLKAAEADLQKVPDKSELEKLLGEAGEIDLTKYTRESGEALQAAIEAAQAVLDNPAADAEAVQEAYDTLNAAVRALSPIDDDQDDDPEDPGQSGSGKDNPPEGNQGSGGQKPQQTVGKPSSGTPVTGDVPLTGIVLYAVIAAAAGGIIFRRRKVK